MLAHFGIEKYQLPRLGEKRPLSYGSYLWVCRVDPFVMHGAYRYVSIVTQALPSTGLANGEEPAEGHWDVVIELSHLGSFRRKSPKP